MKILILSDTHGYLDDAIMKHANACDEIWHAGDFGTAEVSEKLSSVKPLRAVYGNIDPPAVRRMHPLHNRFEAEGLRVWITHIGGYPGKYDPAIRKNIFDDPPDLFITGHSHILKIMRDPNHGNLLHINPGAAGKHGLHTIRTLVKFEILNKKISEVQVVELGMRS